jgi:hypothetical protein
VIENATSREPDDSEFPSLPWPDHAIHVFQGGSLWGIRGVDTLEGWNLYAEGYRQAAERLYADRGNTVNTYLLFPMAFLYRHHVELRIKHMLFVSCEVPGPPLPINWKLDHSLKSIWAELRPRLVSAWYGIPVREVDNVERLIQELHEKDPGSFVFRYPTSRSGNNHLSDPSLDLNSLDMNNYLTTMRQLSEILDILSDCMHEVVRQRDA